MSTATGAVRVGWELEEDGDDTLLTLRWTETGLINSPATPVRKGFGTELITQRVPYELGGTGRLDLLPDRVQAVISFPLRPGESVLQTDAQSARAPHRSQA